MTLIKRYLKRRKTCVEVAKIWMEIWTSMHMPSFPCIYFFLFPCSQTKDLFLQPSILALLEISLELLQRLSWDFVQRKWTPLLDTPHVWPTHVHVWGPFSHFLQAKKWISCEKTTLPLIHNCITAGPSLMKWWMNAPDD